MATYAIGDIQGCYDEFMALLDLIQFNPKKDRLWFTGDLVNRGKKSLEVLRFVKALGDHQITVLGNHDLYLLTVAEGYQSLKTEDTLQPILDAPDRDELLRWLRCQKLLHYDKTLNFTLVHAGIPPQWDLLTALQYAQEVEAKLCSPKEYKQVLRDLFGDLSTRWSIDLTGAKRDRYILNAFSMMRFCFEDGRLNFDHKCPRGLQPSTLYAWFSVPSRRPISSNIVFGHWAALGGKTSAPGIFAVDTGCVWGYRLTALRLEDLKRFSVDCQMKKAR
jgi:bis(5'-nucleosyl)-tetraphosphatase (symmetrical)